MKNGDKELEMKKTNFAKLLSSVEVLVDKEALDDIADGCRQKDKLFAGKNWF